MPQRIVPCLWFDHEAEDAARFYTSIFDNSRIIEVTHYPQDSPRAAGMVMLVEFELDGERFTALNGGPEFTFDEAISLQVTCETQEEIDYYWERLVDGGEESACGWPPRTVISTGRRRPERRSPRGAIPSAGCVGGTAAVPPAHRSRTRRRDVEMDRFPHSNTGPSSPSSKT